MKIWLMTTLLISCMILFSCQNENITSDYPFLDNEDEYITILFSDIQSQQASEHPYYDALIDFQQEYPESPMSVYVADENDTELLSYYEVSTFPTMIIVENNEALVKVEGQNDYQAILDKMETTLAVNEPPSLTKPVINKHNF
ncbi:hypothetical protein [Alkalicoccus halolimnae]|uniref:Small peptidoglycan-associated lipoprotein n=1 Tax=Alkalicoccus halolimnae TaxID=1667239 RepID=A0A5C7FA12_9BACI|nr:hypothetical protein [Alkalicoccus halolimnae]TXF87472.1 hypothetical protein FTX54_01770 [Alkalicoccus halolimnae]